MLVLICVISRNKDPPPGQGEGLETPALPAGTNLTRIYATRY
jgi:hypothetical protein